MDISQMTVLVTGAASGIGHAIAQGFLDDAAQVVGVDLHAGGLEPLADRGAEKEYVLFDPANETYRREFPKRR